MKSHKFLCQLNNCLNLVVLASSTQFSRFFMCSKFSWLRNCHFDSCNVHSGVFDNLARCVKQRRMTPKPTTHAPEIGASFFRARCNRHKKLTPESGVEFMVQISGAGFWSVYTRLKTAQTNRLTSPLLPAGLSVTNRIQACRRDYGKFATCRDALIEPRHSKGQLSE